MDSLGQRIAEKRKAKEMKQEELADMLGITAQAVSKWENDVSCPDIMTLPKLARILDTTTDELLTGTDTHAPTKDAILENKKDPSEVMIKILVTTDDGENVRINIPLTLVRTLLDNGISINSIGGEKIKDANIDWKNILLLAENGAIGKIMDITAEENYIEILVE